MVSERFEISKKEMQSAYDVMKCAFETQIQNLPALFRADFEKYFEDFFETVGIEREGKIAFSYSIVMEGFLPLLSYGYKNGLCEKENFSSFIFHVDGDSYKNLWDFYTEEEARKVEAQKLRVSYLTEAEAKESGIEAPCEYKCYECGANFFAAYRSKYSPAPVCPVCDTELIGWGWN